MDVNPFTGVRARRNFLWNLKQRSFEVDGVIIGHRALVLKTQRLFELVRVDLSPGGLSLSSGFRKGPIKLRQVVLQDGLSFSLGFCTR